MYHAAIARETRMPYIRLVLYLEYMWLVEKELQRINLIDAEPIDPSNELVYAVRTIVIHK